MGEKTANKWISDGMSAYEIEPNQMAKKGTEIKLFLNKAGKDYLKKEKITEVVKKYSDHVQYPIKWIEAKSKDLETLNSAAALWTGKKIYLKSICRIFSADRWGFWGSTVTIQIELRE